MRRAFRGGRVPHFCRRAARRPRSQREAARLGRCPISPTARRSIRAGGFPRPAANKPRKPRVSAEKKTCLAAAFASRRRAGSPLRCSAPAAAYIHAARKTSLCTASLSRTRRSAPGPPPCGAYCFASDRHRTMRLAAPRTVRPLPTRLAAPRTVRPLPTRLAAPRAVQPLPTRLAMPCAVRHRAACILDG